MLKLYSNQTYRRIAWLLGQFLVLVICVSYIQFVYQENILPDKRVKEYYNETSCFLINKKLSEKGRVIHRYRADFLISFIVNGAQYTRVASGNGLDMAYTHNKKSQEDILSQYTEGASYPCYYDPGHPDIAVFVLRQNWLSTLPLIVPSLVFVFVIYYFLKNLFELMEHLHTKRRHKKTKR